MQQIHAAIEHWRHGDFECAIALASTAAEMLPDVDEPRFRELQNISRVNDISNWLIRGASRERLTSGRIDTVVIRVRHRPRDPSRDPEVRSGLLEGQDPADAELSQLHAHAMQVASQSL
jgi:hypothetical protein